jgi:hypothetical protein
MVNNRPIQVFANIAKVPIATVTVLRSLLCSTLFYLCLVLPVMAQGDSPWAYGENHQDGAFVARYAMDLLPPAKPGTVAILTVAFETKVKCEPNVGVAILGDQPSGEGVTYGTPKGYSRGSPVMKVQIDNLQLREDQPFHVEYSDGIEAIMLPNAALTREIMAGTRLRAWLAPNRPALQFPLAGFKTVADRALANCITAASQ